MAATGTTKKVVLLSCGCFNPVTHMHLRLFELARDTLHRTGFFTVVEGIFSPAHDAYKKKDLVASQHRLAMCNLAVKTSSWLRVDDWESKQDGWSTTKTVLNYMTEQARKKHDNSCTVKLLCGADLLESFAVPGLWLDSDIESIVKEHGIVVITRHGSNPEEFIYNSDVLTKHKNNIHIVTEWIPNEISATKIRCALRRRESIKYLVPDSIIDYIHNNKLYTPVKG
ncbi:predicted protein [Nematostella vectensis]|uniref:Nicotinamide-nucleotide adenylyltransferase n=1 Tax=Nematostella vectensis TaxID=45351 RepID=A7RIM0_NEMVE|nr:nicotinamide/nicotinic acid mononucleotide adenylyltransferase 1 [Nematostella vectensis]EDO48825.1 predicted protein [Nematostella vectensis]|eukprot:XP_001640888.1 predicted protein [Nematostella vectensis]